MAFPSRALFCLFLLATLAVSGCTESGDGGGALASAGNDAPPVEATATTGGIRGVVVDDTIKPIADALIAVAGVNKTVTTGDDGLFAISGLQPGTYLIKATHPLYATSQQNVEVVAGEEDPPAVKLQLIRTIFAEPYLQTISYEGYIVCSVNLVVLLSEECGEGAGVPCEVPVVGCQRAGGQDNNNVQFDFTIGSGARTLVIEKAWTPTSDAGKALYSPISTEWSCLPSCSGNTFAQIDGESPLMVHVGNETWEEQDVEIVPDSTLISVFTWASPSYTGAVLSQRYQDFVTVFYYVPAPEGWSFVAGSPSPFA